MIQVNISDNNDVKILDFVSLDFDPIQLILYVSEVHKISIMFLCIS